MKVRELQQALAKLDPALDVVCVCEDEEVARRSDNLVLNIMSVDTADAEKRRDADGVAALAFGGAFEDSSEPHAVITLTTGL